MGKISSNGLGWGAFQIVAVLKVTLKIYLTHQWGAYGIIPAPSPVGEGKRRTAIQHSFKRGEVNTATS